MYLRITVDALTNYFDHWRPWQWRQNQVAVFGLAFSPTHLKSNHCRHLSQHILSAPMSCAQTGQIHVPLALFALTASWIACHASWSHRCRMQWMSTRSSTTAHDSSCGWHRRSSSARTTPFPVNALAATSSATNHFSMTETGTKVMKNCTKNNV